jgi:hypothetical protein
MMGNDNGDDRWKEEDVLRILLNPVYTMGSNPTVDDDQWLNAQKKLLAEQGEDEYFRRLLTEIQGTFGEFID